MGIKIIQVYICSHPTWPLLPFISKVKHGYPKGTKDMTTSVFLFVAVKHILDPLPSSWTDLAKHLFEFCPYNLIAAIRSRGSTGRRWYRTKGALVHLKFKLRFLSNVILDIHPSLDWNMSFLGAVQYESVAKANRLARRMSYMQLVSNSFPT